MYTPFIITQVNHSLAIPLPMQNLSLYQRCTVGYLDTHVLIPAKSSLEIDVILSLHL